jgi:UDP-2,3-diacylglucosamine pyrophosphatase LpxH
MRFLNRSKKKFKKTVLVISDLHLSAGAYINGRKNPLEDFHSDEELVEFLKFYSSGDFVGQEVELIINGDFLDFLAVPYVEFFDDEFWSQEAALKKLELIYHAHSEVFDALNDFLNVKKKSLTYIIGNHDAELVLGGVREQFLSYFDEKVNEKITLTKELDLYEPVKGVFIKHGHQYETAHNFDPNNTIVHDNEGRPYLMPSWGSNYVINIINKYKQERAYVNQVRPIKHFLIHGLLFDTFFTIRFMLATAYYFMMVRFRHYILDRKPFSEIAEGVMEELLLFEDFEELTKEFFQLQKDAKVLIVGHTHHPTYRSYVDGSIFINTGTWTKMTSLDFNNFNSGFKLTYAKVQVIDEEKAAEDFEKNVELDLFQWVGKSDLPYYDFN